MSAARSLAGSLEAALHGLAPPSARTWDGETLLRLRTCAALSSALARVRSAEHTDADTTRVVLATLRYLVDALTQDAGAVRELQWYWAQIEESPWQGTVYWVQTLPERVGKSVYSIAHRGLPRSALVTLRGVRMEAHARGARLSEAYDALAETLGSVALAWHANEQASDVQALVHKVAKALGSDDAKAASVEDAASVLLDAVARHESRVARLLASDACGKPSLLARTWPLLVAYPLVSIGITQYVSANWTSIVEQLTQAGATLRGLVIGWVYEPAMRLLDTVRAGQAERRMIISRDSLAADQHSLERMVAELGSDKLKWRDGAIADAVQRVQHGDLTSVMELYERDIRTPLRSLLGGSLIRTVLIQVQKAKVDLEVALSGIDWLLRSQELLIGFVGLAPALALVYLLWTQGVRCVRSLLYGEASVKVQRTVRDARLGAWEALRRVDALVSRGDTAGAKGYGFLLLDVDTLRTSFGTLVPAAARDRAVSSRLEAEIAQDLGVLEAAGQTALLSDRGGADAWAHRQATVDRMWRSWSWLLAMNKLVH